MDFEEEVCSRNYRVLLQLLQRYFDPFEYLEAMHYLEFARTLLDFYRCEKVAKVRRDESGYVEDIHTLFSKLIQICVGSVVEKYKVFEYRAKLKKHLRKAKIDELEKLQKYIVMGLQIAGLNLPSLVPYSSDPIFLKYVGSIVKMVAIIAIEVEKFWAQRAIRKFSVKVEELARALIREIERDLRATEEKTIDKTVITLMKSFTDRHQLEELSRDLLREEVYTNTPEVISFAMKLQKLRGEFLLGSKTESVTP